MSANHPNALLACADCDALQVLTHGSNRTQSSCWRCGAWLGNRHDDHLERVLALVIAAIVLYLIANFAPLVQVNLEGDEVTTTLAGSASSLWRAGMEPIAVLVFITTVLLPAAYLGALCYLTAGLLWIERSGKPRRLPAADLVLRTAQHAQAWSMLEVFLVGAMVAVVRLQPVATVDVRSALWAVGALVLLFAILMSSFHPGALWARLERAAGSA
jgi:paraquat-inducible protein A